MTGKPQEAENRTSQPEELGEIIRESIKADLPSGEKIRAQIEADIKEDLPSADKIGEAIRAEIKRETGF